MEMLTGLGILLLSSIGHAEYWVLFVNRAYSLRIDHRQLRILRRIHDIAIPIYTLVLLWQVGFGENGLLTGGAFNDQSPTVQWILTLTSLGVIPWLLGILRWQYWQKHAFRRADSREFHDVLNLAERNPELGDVRGPRQRLSGLFPWNEVFRLEVNTKTIVVDSWKGGRNERPLRIVHFSDLHFVGCPGEGYYRWVFRQAAALRPDAFVFTGDLIDDPELVPMAVDILSTLTAIAPCFFVLGNHDWRFDHEQLRQTVQRAGWINVAGQTLSVELGGRRVVISGSERPWLGHNPPSPEGDGTALRLFVSHSPDQVGFALRGGYDVMLAGHTHGGQVVLPVIGPVYSPSIHGVRFAAGTFPIGPMHLHVSRGVGGKDPLRWRCCPELTCLQITNS